MQQSGEKQSEYGSSYRSTYGGTQMRGMDVTGACQDLMKTLNIDRLVQACNLHSCMQTLAVLAYLGVAFGYTSCLGFFTFIAFLFSPFFLVAWAYGYWYYKTIDHPYKGGYNFKFLKNLTIWRYFRDYFPIRFHKTADLDTTKNYIFAVHPSGIINAGSMAFFGTGSTDYDRYFPGITPHLFSHKAQFYFPITRELLLFSGGCADDRRSMEWVLNNRGLWAKKGQACIINVAGNEEVLEQTKPGQVTLLIKQRRDFLRAALQTGASIVPVFSFGENQLYHLRPSGRGSFLRSIQDFVRSFTNIPFPIISGRGVSRHSFGFLPMRRPVDVVVGKAIDVNKVEYPSEEQVSQLQDQYLKELENLFNEHKAKYLDNKETRLFFK